MLRVRLKRWPIGRIERNVIPPEKKPPITGISFATPFEAVSVVRRSTRSFLIFFTIGFQNASVVARVGVPPAARIARWEDSSLHAGEAPSIPNIAPREQTSW